MRADPWEREITVAQWSVATIFHISLLRLTPGLVHLLEMTPVLERTVEDCILIGFRVLGTVLLMCPELCS